MNDPDGLMTHPDSLTLASIDSMRHLAVSELIVRAVAFAARAGHTDRTAYRFVSALVMTGALQDSIRWPEVLKRVMDLERETEARAPEPCPIHPDEPDDAGCGEEADAARMTAGLLGIPLTGAQAPEHNIEHDRTRLED